MKLTLLAVIQALCDFVYLYPLLMSFVWMIGALIFFFRLERGKRVPPEMDEYPLFSVLVPCHNEKDQIGDTVDHLADLDYPNYEVILIDDGSTDETPDKIHEFCKKHERVRGVYLKQNGGKASALNAGCLVSRGDLILSIDADALVDKNCLKWMAWHFIKFPRVGAITGNPRAICWIFVPETLGGLWKQRVRWAQGGVEVLKKHNDIWQDWRQRRLWPVYIEYACSILWVLAFWTLIIMWAEQTFFAVNMTVRLLPPIPPLWTGSILALVCLMQFALSLLIDSRYDKKILRYLFWVVWYPFVYWMINAFAVVIAVPKALLKKKGTRAVWVSPDRGLEKISAAGGK